MKIALVNYENKIEEYGDSKEYGQIIKILWMKDGWTIGKSIFVQSILPLIMVITNFPIVSTSICLLIESFSL